MNWRPDIYKESKDFSLGCFQDALIKKLLLPNQSTGLLEFGALHTGIEFPSMLTRDVIYIDTMAVDEKLQRYGYRTFHFLKC